MTTPTLEFCFRARLDFPEGPRTRFKPAYADFVRGFVPVVGGEFSGPRLQARVVPMSGGDWPQLRQTGLVDFEAHYMLEASDGTPIYVHNRGIAYSSPEVMAQLEAGQPIAPDASYCRVTPRFEAPAGPHEWLNRTVFVGTAEKGATHAEFEFFAVR